MGKLINNVWVDWIDKVKVLQKCVVKNKQGKLLALKRPESEYERSGCWDLPGGSIDPEDIQKWKAKSGHGDEHDILVKAITREILEETGLKVKNIRAIHSASGFNDQKGVFVVAIGYMAHAINPSQIKLSQEHIAFKWVTKNEFLKLNVGKGKLVESILARV